MAPCCIKRPGNVLCLFDADALDDGIELRRPLVTDETTAFVKNRTAPYP